MGGDVEGPTALVAWVVLAPTGGEDVLGAGAGGVFPSPVKKKDRINQTLSWQNLDPCLWCKIRTTHHEHDFGYQLQLLHN